MDHLRQLQNIIQATSREIMWINDCEEEELLYDWSDRNTNIAQKQEAFSVSLPLGVVDARLLPERAPTWGQRPQ